MDNKLLTILRCPKCFNSVLKIEILKKEEKGVIIDGVLSCGSCGEEYEIRNSIPVLLYLPKAQSGDKKGNEFYLKNKQIEFYDEKCDEEFEINRPHSAGKLYNYFIDYKFNKVSSAINLKNKYVLDACCGSGMASEYYAKFGADVVGMDISFAAVNRAMERSRKYNFPAKFIVGDTSNLPFKENVFDYTSVHDGLHHLEKPVLGVHELLRVARNGVFITEPANAILTRISTIFGISTDYEDAGNFVYRFSKSEFKHWVKEKGFQNVSAVRYLMFYPHFPPKWFRPFELSPVLTVFKILYKLINIAAGQFGNKIFLIVNKI